MNFWKKKNILKNFNKSYKNLLILKFSNIFQNSRFTFDRFDKIIVKNELTIQKRNLLIEILYNRKIVLSWKFSKMKKIRSEIVFSQIIKIIKYRVWQISKFSIFKIFTKIMTKMLKKQINRNILKFCHDSYRNSWFLVKKKKSNKYKIINAILKMNRVIVRDVNLFFAIDEFVENFVECTIAFSLIFFLITIKLSSTKSVAIWQHLWHSLNCWKWRFYFKKSSILLRNSCAS